MRLLTLKKTLTTLALCLSVLLTGCSTSPKILTHYSEDVDFTQYQTFSFFDPIADKKKAYSTLLDQYIKSGVTKELEKRGLKEVAEGDVKISFNVHKKERIQSTTVPATYGGYYGYRGVYGYNMSYGMNQGSETSISQYTEGTLNIDVVDRVQKQLIWEGAAIGRLNDEIPEDVEKVVHQIVANILAEYPIRSLVEPKVTK
ncbi:MAG: hypothetical protein ACI9N9_001406 [Enterobacterales bacterium]|jgi:hypothetical protein